MPELTRLGKILAFDSPEAAAEAIRGSFEAWPCPVCGGEVTVIRGKAVADRRCYDCIRQDVYRPPGSRLGRAATLRDCGTPARFLAPFVETAWPVRPAGVESDAWRGEPWSCGFVGEARSGKTFLATELLWRVMEQTSFAAMWVASDELADSGFANGADREVYQRARSVKCLLIDDLGWGGGLEKLAGLLRARHAEMLPTIWTGNLSRAELAKSTAGQPLASRLWDDGWVFAVSGRWKPVKP